MAKLTRKTHKVFGASGSSDNFAKFGSEEAGTPIKTKDIATIQALPAWDEGIQEALYSGNKAILLEDLNALFYEHSYQVGTVLQDGIPAWDAGTTYYIGSVARRDGTSELYASLTNDNINQALPSQADNAQWEYLSKPKIVDGGVSVDAIPKVSAAAPGVVVDSALSDDGVNVITALPIKFPDDTEQATAAAPVSTQAVVTGTRTTNIVYQNTSGKTMYVCVTLAIVQCSVVVYTDAAAAPVTEVTRLETNESSQDTRQLFFIVLPGNYYKLTAAGTTFDVVVWTEWK